MCHYRRSTYFYSSRALTQDFDLQLWYCHFYLSKRSEYTTTTASTFVQPNLRSLMSVANSVLSATPAEAPSSSDWIQICAAFGFFGVCVAGQ